MAYHTLLLLSCLLGLTAIAKAQEQPRVQVYAEHQGGNVIYRYEVRNGGPGEVRRFQVGCDCRAAGALPQLRTLPQQAQPERTDDFGTWFDLPPQATTQPPGWRARVLRPKGTTGHWLEWYMPAARTNAGVAVGQTLVGFSVTVPAPDDTYLTSHYTAYPGNPKGALDSAPLALLDTAPPILTLDVNAAAADAGAAAVRVLANAKDDRDPEPRVVVESMGRADTAEPGYIVTYSATDASGNRATATSRVRLPVETKPVERHAPPPTTNLPRLAFLP